MIGTSVSPRTANELHRGVEQASEQIEQASEQAVYRPNVDIVETPDAVLLTADVPGADENSVDMMLENQVLSIRARVAPPKFEGYVLANAEYGVGDFERTFTLSQDIDRAGIEAVVKDGVLQVKLPKVKEAAARKIRVGSG